MSKKLKLYIKKYSLNAKESSRRETEEQEKDMRQKAKSKMADVNPTTSILTLNVSGLKNPIKR